MHSCWPTL